MDNKELYPELADYIFNYCENYFWEKERLANRHLTSILKHDASNITRYKIMQQKGWISSDAEVLELVKNGFASFKSKVTQRIFDEHKNKLELNLYPKCGKIARTPLAKQCRFCHNNWH